MKSVKLAVATTLSMMALSFTGIAFADGDRDYGYDNDTVKSSVNSHKVVNKKFDRRKKIIKRVVVKNTPTKKVIVTKTIIKKPAKIRYAKNKRFQHVKRFNREYAKYQKRMNRENRYKRTRAKQTRVQRTTVYSVRPGDTLIQISYKTGVSIKRLARLNRIKNRDLNYLQVGQVLRLV